MPATRRQRRDGFASQDAGGGHGERLRNPEIGDAVAQLTVEVAAPGGEFAGGAQREEMGAARAQCGDRFASQHPTGADRVG